MGKDGERGDSTKIPVKKSIFPSPRFFKSWRKAGDKEEKLETNLLTAYLSKQERINGLVVVLCQIQSFIPPIFALLLFEAFLHHLFGEELVALRWDIVVQTERTEL